MESFLQPHPQGFSLKKWTVTLERIQEKEVVNGFQRKGKGGTELSENVSAVINRWIHRQGKYEKILVSGRVYWDIFMF